MFKKFVFTSAFIAVILAYFYIQQNSHVTLEKEIIKSWRTFVNLPERNLNRNFRIAIGLNTNVDLILSGAQLFRSLKATSKNPPKNCQHIGNLSEFKECFIHFFRKGSAAERYFIHLNDFETVLKATQNLDQKLFIGGNAGLMAESISNKLPDVDVYLVGPVGETLKNLLNKNIIIPNMIEKDEIHLILEYAANEMIDTFESPAANRFIVSHDIYNSEMKMMDEFFEVIVTYMPDLIILSGLHLLESQSMDVRLEKLESLRQHLIGNHYAKNVIHLELASIGDQTLMKSILDYNFLNDINSLGLNEQELLFLAHSSGKSPHANYYNEITGQPDIVKVVDILNWILNTYGKSDANPKSLLTRIHFHCLVFHLIVIRDENVWSNTVSSLMAGSKIASKQACGFEFHDQNESNLDNLVQFKTKHELTDNNRIQFTFENDKYVEFDSGNPVSEFQRGQNRFYFTPVLICKVPLKTVGLGDAISSIGLVYSLFNHSS